MKQRLGLAIVLFCLMPALFAQQKAKQNAREDNASFMFTESQLNEDDDAAQSTSALVTSNNDVYLSNVGYLFSPMRFRVRGYDSQYSDMYINGVQFNDAETGRFSYGLIGGLNDATRNKEGIGPFEFNNFTFGAIGGATNINLRASQYAAGSKLTLSGSNRNYILRGMYTYSTGLMNNGWAFTGSLGYRWGNEGNIEGIKYNSFSYFLGAEKVFNERHSLSLATWGTPTERGQQMAATEEAYYLANSHYYNPNWGYQNGEKRNARIVRQFEPSAIASWNFTIDDNKKLVTSAGFKYSNYGKSALGWNGNAADPRPDYYKKLPSSIFDVWESVPTADELQQFNEVTDNWKNNKAYRQLDWDALYFANKQANALGKETLYYVEERHDDQLAFNFSSVFNHQWNEHNSYIAGVAVNTTKGMHYKKMKDLLGGQLYTDVDKFAVRDHGASSSMVQNDLDNPNRRIGEGDKFGYDYNIYVNKQSAWVRYQGNNGGSLNYFASGKIGSTQMFRDGLMRNGRAPLKSLGSSGTAKFLEGGIKAGLNWAINGNHSFTLNAGYEERAPLAYNSFIAPRIKNDFVRDLKTERIIGGDLTYNFNTPWVMGRLTGYYTRFQNQVEMDAFYNDSEARFTYLSMNGIEKEHWGIEAAATFKLTSELSLTAIGTWSEAKYTNNPDAVLTYESENESNLDRVYAKGMRANGTPLSAYSLALDYNVKGWFFNLTGNYFASGKIGSTQMFRDGLMRNGRAPLKSLGSSGTAKFLEGGIKAGLNWAINGNHSFTLNAGYEERAPLAYNSFIAPRIKNDFVRDLKTERIIGGDLTYNFNTPWVMGRLTGYYTRFQNQVEMDAFYNDSEARFTYLSMNGIEKEHWGIEAAATFKLTSELSLTAIGTWSEAKYTNNPDAVLTYESENESNLDRVYAKGMRANGTPLSAYSLALDYNVKGWFFNLTGNYYDRVYIDFSSYRRLGSVLDKNGAGVDANGNPVLHVPGQEKLDGGFMLDASIGKYIRLRNGKSISLNLSLTNILNNTDLRTGGFEQNRDDNYKDGDARVYKFSKNSKYFYAFPFNAFLNIGYRF